MGLSKNSVTPCDPMDRVLVYEARLCRFESYQGDQAHVAQLDRASAFEAGLLGVRFPPWAPTVVWLSVAQWIRASVSGTEEYWFESSRRGYFFRRLEEGGGNSDEIL